jgi:hypothetical protein
MSLAQITIPRWTKNMIPHCKRGIAGLELFQADESPFFCAVAALSGVILWNQHLPSRSDSNVRRSESPPRSQTPFCWHYSCSKFNSKIFRNLPLRQYLLARRLPFRSRFLVGLAVRVECFLVVIALLPPPFCPSLTSTHIIDQLTSSHLLL